MKIVFILLGLATFAFGCAGVLMGYRFIKEVQKYSGQKWSASLIIFMFVMGIAVAIIGVALMLFGAFWPVALI